MKYFNRSMLGIVIGVSISALVIAVCIYCATLNNLGVDINGFKLISGDYVRRFIYVITVLVISASFLLVLGIMMKRHEMMLPWLIIHGIGVALCLMGFVPLAVVGVFVKYFPIIVVIIGIKAISFWFLYTLYEAIRIEIIVKKLESLKNTKAVIP